MVRYQVTWPGFDVINWEKIKIQYHAKETTTNTLNIYILILYKIIIVQFTVPSQTITVKLQ